MPRPKARPSTYDLNEVATTIERTIREESPQLTRVTKYGAPTFQGRGDVITIGVWKTFVAVGFWSGAKLAARHSILEGTAPSSRVVKFRSVEEARSPRFRALIRDAVLVDSSDPVHSR